jgi:hypothetical protein
MMAGQEKKTRRARMNYKAASKPRMARITHTMKPQQESLSLYYAPFKADDRKKTGTVLRPSPLHL